MSHQRLLPGNRHGLDPWHLLQHGRNDVQWKWGRITPWRREPTQGYVSPVSSSSSVEFWDDYRHRPSITNIYRIICIYRLSTSSTNCQKRFWETKWLVSCIPTGKQCDVDSASLQDVSEWLSCRKAGNCIQVSEIVYHHESWSMMARSLQATFYFSIFFWDSE